MVLVAVLVIVTVALMLRWRVLRCRSLRRNDLPIGGGALTTVGAPEQAHVRHSS
jgi:hypothetical protein